MRKCSKCKKEKELYDFNIDNSVKDKLSRTCRDCNRNERKQYYTNNRNKIREYRKREYTNNRAKLLEKSRRWKQKTFDGWKKYLPIKTNCQICGKNLILGCSNKKNSIHFDHRSEGRETIKGSPSYWLRRTPATPDTIKIWDNCNFGILCEQCNIRLPTIGRKEFIRRAVVYVFGKEVDLE